MQIAQNFSAGLTRRITAGRMGFFSLRDYGDTMARIFKAGYFEDVLCAIQVQSCTLAVPSVGFCLQR
jgi:hypothetical protein